MSPSLLAVAHEDSGVEIVSLLVEAKADLQRDADSAGKGLVHRAAEFGNEKVFEALVNRWGLSPTTKAAGSGVDPMCCAIARGNLSFARWLIAQKHVKEQDMREFETSGTKMSYVTREVDFALLEKHWSSACVCVCVCGWVGGCFSFLFIYLLHDPAWCELQRFVIFVSDLMAGNMSH